jgi:hypothetical protein
MRRAKVKICGIIHLEKKASCKVVKDGAARG